MSRMTKTFMILFSVLLTTGSALAQWQPSDVNYISLDKDGTYGQMQTKALRTDDGKTVLTWLRWSEGLELDDPASGYSLHLQVFDAEGKAMFGDEGIIVCDKPTASYTTDYGLALASNGDILIAYMDTRNDANKQMMDVYVYRYDQEGQPVWSADGVKIVAKITQVEGSQYGPSLCVSGDNIYVSLIHSELFNEHGEGDEEGRIDYQIIRLDDEGAAAWDSNVVQDTNMLLLLFAPEGDVYLIYGTDSYGLEAQRLNKDGQFVWATPVTVESDPLSPGPFMPSPDCSVDEEGGVVLAYRKITDWGGFELYNRLTPDGKAIEQTMPCNGSLEGDAGADVIATKGQQTLVAWELQMGGLMMYMNLLQLDGSYAWTDGKQEGLALDAGSEWGYRPVKIIPQNDGWVVFYGNATDWNTAKFLVCKINDEGETMWSKQLAEGDFRSSGFSIVYDDTYAYIFFTREEEYDENGIIILGSGGLFVMCVDISNAGNPSSILKPELNNDAANSMVYDLNGRRVIGKPTQRGIYIVDGKKQVKKQ